VVEVPGAAEVVDGGQVLLQRLRYEVEELVLVDRAGGAALGAGPVVGQDHDQGVVELADLAQEVQQPADVMVGVLQEAGEHLHHAGVQAALLGRAVLPPGHVGVVARQLRVGRDDPQLLLPGEDPVAVGLPAVVEGPLVAVGPLPGDVVRGVHRPGGEVQEERLVGGDLLGVGDEGGRPVDQVLGEVVALLGRPLGLDPLVVGGQLRIVLVGVAAQEPVVAVEPSTQRPAVIGPGRRDLVGGGEVPLADRVGVVALVVEDLRQEAVLEGDVAVIAWEPGGDLGDPGQVVGVVVAAGQHARPAG
jgi:hypothetical protein